LYMTLYILYSLLHRDFWPHDGLISKRPKHALIYLTYYTISNQKINCVWLGYYLILVLVILNTTGMYHSKISFCLFMFWFLVFTQDIYLFSVHKPRILSALVDVNDSLIELISFIWLKKVRETVTNTKWMW
jgi:hypothetical protein